MKELLMKRRLSDEQKKSIKSHIEKIQKAHKELQNILTEFGIEPITGWKNPNTYQLVKGIEFVRDDECDECSVVCFDGDCGECLECAGDVINYRNISWVSNPVERVLLETTRDGILKVHLKAK